MLRKGNAAANSNADEMTRLIRGYWISQIAGTLAQLGIPDHLATGPRGCDELAKWIRCEPQATFRLLRASATVGLVSAMPDGRFTLTPLGGILRTDAVGSMRDLAIALTAPGHWLPWGRLLDAVRRGERQTPAALGQELFEYYANNPAEGHAFTGAMSNSSVPIADELAEVLDTSSARWVVDVGGASGAIIAALLEKNPSLEGIILERPDVVSRAKAAVAERGLSSRCHVVEGDFFEAVPEADVHILKYIIHDWDDEQSIKILSNCAHSLRKNGRVVIVERLIPVDGHISDTPLMDLNMLVLLPGRERNASHYGDLLDRAGLRLERIHDTGSPLKVLEATLRAQ